MQKFQEKRRIKKVVYSIGMVAILLGIVFWLGGAVFDVYEKAKITKDRRLDALSELEELKKTEAELRARIDTLLNERGIEEAVREKFDVAKEGEKVIKIIDTQDIHATDQSETEEIPWWKKFWDR